MWSMIGKNCETFKNEFLTWTMSLGMKIFISIKIFYIKGLGIIKKAEKPICLHLYKCQERGLFLWTEPM